MARDEYLTNLASYRRPDKLLQIAIPAFRFSLVSIAARVVFVLCPYWLWRILTGHSGRGLSAALLYLGVTLNSYYLLIASVEYALPRYVEAFERITLAIDIIAFSVILNLGAAMRRVRCGMSAVRGRLVRQPSVGP